MRITEFTQQTLEHAPRKFVHDFHTLGSFAKINPQSISYCNREKHNLVKRFRKNGRTVFESLATLARVQERLRPLFLEMYDEAENVEHIIAYRKGINPRAVIQQHAGSDQLILTDIKKYFDNITFEHIVRLLMECGYSRQGAKLITKFCTVRTRNGQTLQQGSAVSGDISNLVGYLFYDKAIQEWVEAYQEEHPGLDLTYIRYCDNLALFINGGAAIPEGIYSDFRTAVDEIMEGAGFATHDWQHSVNNTHQKMKFLGVILNKWGRIEKDKFSKLRATLFNCCRNGILHEAEKYFERCPSDLLEMLPQQYRYRVMREKFLQYMRGNVSYVRSVGPVQGPQLRKLLDAAIFLDERPGIRILNDRDDGRPYILPDPIMDAVKLYRDRRISHADYLGELATATATCI